MRENQRQTRRRYSTNNESLDAEIEQLVASSGFEANADLLEQLVTSCFRLARDHAHRGEMKLVNAALKEFAYAFKIFKKYRGTRKVSIFGSARAHPKDPNYEMSRQLGAVMAKRGWMVITGAGPGIMEAGHLGAGAEQSFGANIRLPLEADPNEVIEGDPKLINFKYFFTRKVTFLKESDAFVLLPGGFGTLDETFELLTLMQTGKSDVHPVVLLEAPGSGYWTEWQRFIDRGLGNRNFISEYDASLFSRTESVQRAVKEIDGFYRNYHSVRYVKGVLVLRLQRLPSAEALERLSSEFSDLSDGQPLRVVEPTAQEVEEGDVLECGRIAVRFNQREPGRLRQLIDALNEF